MTTLRSTIHHQIFSALGLTGILAACGGEVIVVQARDGAGGAGGASSSTTVGPTTAVGTTTSSSTGMSPFECNVPVPELARLELACLEPQPDGTCPSDPQAALNEQFEGECDDPATCWCAEQIDDFCGCYSYVSDVPCGPAPVGAEPCCYYAMIHTDGFCEGRPFRVDDEVRTARVVERDDWSTALPLSPDDLDARTRRALADAWERDAAFEHASVASFARHVLELLAVGAPADLVHEAQAAVGDEVEHARLCFGLASAYRGMPRGPGRLDVAGANPGADLRSVAVSVAREGCLHETVAALLAAEAAERCEVWAVKASLRQIAEDEGRHAALGWRFLAWACAQDEAVRDAVVTVLRDAVLPEPEPMPDGLEEACWNAHGRLTATQQSSVIAAARREVFAPALTSLAQPRAVSETMTPSVSP